MGKILQYLALFLFLMILFGKKAVINFCIVWFILLIICWIIVELHENKRIKDGKRWWEL